MSKNQSNPSQEPATSNPANDSVKEMQQVARGRTRVPMSLPLQKLEVPEDAIPGYHLHWMMGDPARLAQADRAGYEFVNADEISITNTGLANDATSSGNTDMGTRVSVVAGGTGDDGQAQRLYLMKIKQEWWEEDQEKLADRNEKVAEALRGGEDAPGTANPHGADHRYIPESQRKAVANLFIPRNRRV